MLLLSQMSQFVQNAYIISNKVPILDWQNYV